MGWKENCNVFCPCAIPPPKTTNIHCKHVVLENTNQKTKKLRGGLDCGDAGHDRELQTMLSCFLHVNWCRHFYGGVTRTEFKLRAYLRWWWHCQCQSTSRGGARTEGGDQVSIVLVLFNGNFPVMRSDHCQSHIHFLSNLKLIAGKEKNGQRKVAFSVKSSQLKQIH